MKINYKRRKAGLKKVRSLLNEPEHVWFIHYSCESFYNKEEPFSSRISSIAVRRLSDGLTHVYSISREASFQRLTPSQISDEQYALLEKSLLDNFYQFLKQETSESCRTRTFIHWRMKSDEFGFSALDHRYHLLGIKNAYRVKDENKVDLSRLLADIYGEDYVEKPCLTSLVHKNGFTLKDYLTGAEESLRFEQKKFEEIHRSTKRKVSLFELILKAIDNRELKTNASWWNQHRGDCIRPFNWIHRNETLNGAFLAYAIFEAFMRLVSLF